MFMYIATFDPYNHPCGVPLVAAAFSSAIKGTGRYFSTNAFFRSAYELSRSL